MNAGHLRGIGLIGAWAWLSCAPTPAQQPPPSPGSDAGLVDAGSPRDAGLRADSGAAVDAGPLPTIGIAASNGGFVVTAPDGGILLQSYAGDGGAYSTLAVRTSADTYTMEFGSFLIGQDTSPWETSASFTFAPADGGGTGVWADDGGTALATLTASPAGPNVLVLTVRAVNPSQNRVSLTFDCAAADHFLGFGEQSDAMDHHGHKIPIWTSEHGVGKSSSDDPPALWFVEGARHSSNLGLPTWLSQRGYIAALQTPHRSIFELCSVQPDAFRVESWSDELTLWIFYGPAPADALTLATGALFGRPVRPPPLAFAPWNDAIFGTANVSAIAGVIRDAGIPSSVIWTEDYRGGTMNSLGYYTITQNWGLDATLYPDAGDLANELHDAGFAWLAYFNSFITQGADMYGDAVDGGWFVQAPQGGDYLFTSYAQGQAGLLDLTNPAAVEGVKGYMRNLLDVGFDGWMADFGEWLPADAFSALAPDPLQEHLLYALQWSQVNADLLAERAGDGRQRLFFARSGWYGTPSVAPVFWPADQRTDFETDDGMPTVIPLALGAGLAGVSTFGSDIAGYQSATNPASTKELFFRWTELGALSPVMRTHHGDAPNLNWSFDKDAETLAHFARWTRFHMQLYPYLDASSAVAESTGVPLMRELALQYPDDPAGWTIDDEYALGPALLVAPVVTQGATARTVHLPPGHWFPLWTGAPVDGPADVSWPAAVTEIPLFAPAGTVIPCLPDGVQTVLPAANGITTLADKWGERELWVFAGAPGVFTERDGTQYTLSASAPTSGYAESGVALPACAAASQRGCVDATVSPPRVKLAHGGPLSFGGWTLTIQGPARTVDVLVTQ